MTMPKSLLPGPSPHSKTDAPTTYVYNLDNINDKPQIIRMTPRAAVAWCYAGSVGQMGRLNVAEPFIRRMDTGWICGSYWARDDGEKAHDVGKRAI